MNLAVLDSKKFHVHLKNGAGITDLCNRYECTQDELIENIDKIHTTDMGMDRIKRNLGLKDIDAVEWCKEKILDKDAVITRQGKNWYVKICDNIITVNAKSYTIITAHKRKCLI